MPRRKSTAQETHKLGQVGAYWLSQKPNSPYWHLTWYDPKTRQTRRESLRERDFQAAHAALIGWVQKNGPTWSETDPKTVKLVDLFEWYYTSHLEPLPSARFGNTAFSYWLDFFGENALVSDISRLSVDRFIEHHRELNHAHGYIDGLLNFVRSALKRAEKYDLLSRAPFIPAVQSAEQASNVKPKGRPLNLSEMAKLLVQPWLPHQQVYLGILVNTACRPAAAYELRGDQVDYEHNLLDLNPVGRRQTNKRRPLIPMTPSLVRLFRGVEAQRRASHRGDTPFRMGTYVALPNGRSITKIDASFRKVVASSGIERPSEITSYSFRHTVARELRRAKVDSEEISLLLGHRPRGVSMTTGIYAPYEPEYLDDAVRALEAYVQRIGEEARRQLEEIDSSALVPSRVSNLLVC